MAGKKKFSFANLLDNLTSKQAVWIIVITGFVVYFNSLFNGFVGDDGPQIVDNPAVHSLGNVLNYFTGSTFYNGGQLTGHYYRPIQSLIYATIYSLVGANAFYFHLVQIIIHICNSIFVLLIFKKFFKKEPSIFLALLFLVHPINSESVFYTATLQDSLSFLFGILSLWMMTSELRNRLLYGSLLLLLSLFSKETGMIFAVLFIVYSFLFRRKEIISVSFASIAIAAFYLILRLRAVGFMFNPQSAPISTLELSGRMANIPAIVFFYIKTFVYPLNLASSYQWVIRSITITNFILPFIFDILFLSLNIIILVWFYKKHFYEELRVNILFFAWFLLGLSLHLQIIRIDMTVAEHWFYFPIVGLLGMIGGVLNKLKIRKINKSAVELIFIAILLLLSLRTIIRSFDWRNDFILASHDIKYSKDAYDLENTIAFELLKQDKLDEAEEHAIKSLDIYPYFTNLNTLGLIYLNKGNYKAAKDAYMDSLKYGDYYIVYENLGGLAMVYGDTNENIEFLKSAVGKFPNDSKLWLYLALLNYKVGNTDEAKITIKRAYSLDNNQNNFYFYNKIINGETINVNFNTKPK